VVVAELALGKCLNRGPLEDTIVMKHLKIMYSGLAAVLLTCAPLTMADGVAGGNAANAPAPTTATRPVDARYASPTAVIKTLALAIKSGNGKSIRRCLVVNGNAGRAAVAAFANISSASETFTKTAISKLGTPPATMANAFGSIDDSMNRLLTLLPKAVVTIHGTAAQVTFPHTATGNGQTIFVRQSLGGWRVDGAKLLHLDQPGMAATAVRHRARQLNLLAAALDKTTADINTGKVKTWTSLEKDMELHILEVQAAMESSKQAKTAAPVLAGSPPPAAK
jgi:hypothetical protein